MFGKVEPLDKKKHKALKFDDVNGFGFAKSMTTVPLCFSEIVPASKYYPVVFSATDKPVPLAVLGAKPKENVFVDDSGNWTVPYVPVHIRRYPFILSRVDEKDNYVVCIDVDAPHLNTEKGTPLFTENGEPSKGVARTIEMLKKYQKEMSETQGLFTSMLEKGLLVEKQVAAGYGDEKKNLIRGFRIVDMEKLMAQDKETLGDWVKRGIIGLFYGHFYSMSNLQAVLSKG